MKDRFQKLLFPLIASALSGVLLFIAFPTYDMGWLAWVGLVPLLLAIHDKRILYSFLLSLGSGIIFTAGIYEWILVVDGYRFYHHAMLVFYLALYLGMFGLIFAIVAKRRSVTFALLLSPFIWVSLEYVKSNLLFLSLPWALLAHSQHQVLPIIQIASMTGAYGVSFLVVMVNSALTILLLSFPGRSGWYQSSSAHLPSRRIAYVITTSTALLICVVLIYGWLALASPNSEKDIKISVLQGNIEQDRKWDPNYAAIIMDTYIDLSRVAAKDDPRLIVWPEAATPGFILKNIALYKQTAALIRETNIHYFIGSSEYPKFKKEPIELSKVGNSALFFSPQGKVIGQYFKIYLVPFVEFIPYGGFISWPHFISPRKKTNWGILGKEYTLFGIDGHTFGVSICWESLFPNLFRKYVKQGADFMLNISSEAWFGVSAFQYQFLAATKFRAVENRTSIARAGNYSIACFIDPYGRITRDYRGTKEEEILRKGHLTRKIAISREKTFYTIYGDIFVYIIIALTVLATAYALVKPKNLKKSFPVNLCACCVKGWMVRAIYHLVSNSLASLMG